MSIGYCKNCLEKHSLNKRTFMIFGKRCEICGKISNIYINTEIEFDEDLGVLLFKKLRKLWYRRWNKKTKEWIWNTRDLLINKFSVLNQKEIEVLKGVK